MKSSNLWKFALRSLPVLGICALAACSSAPKVTPQSTTQAAISVNVKSAQKAYEAGAFARAAKFYELALSDARAHDDSAEIGRNAYNAAACHLRAGDAKSAAALLVEADREFRRSKQSLMPVLVLQARAALALDQLADAEKFVRDASTLSKRSGDLVEAMLVLSEVYLRRGDLPAAQRAIASVQMEAAQGGAVSAMIADAEGRLLIAQSKHAEAGRKFEVSAKSWRDAGNAGEMAAALQAAGNAFAQTGDPTRAADLLYRAARSYSGQHENRAALGCVQAAMKAAESAQDEKLRDQIGALFAQIKKSVEPAGAAH